MVKINGTKNTPLLVFLPSAWWCRLNLARQVRTSGMRRWPEMRAAEERGESAETRLEVEKVVMTMFCSSKASGRGECHSPKSLSHLRSHPHPYMTSYQGRGRRESERERERDSCERRGRTGRTDDDGTLLSLHVCNGGRMLSLIGRLARDHGMRWALWQRPNRDGGHMSDSPASLFRRMV